MLEAVVVQDEDPVVCLPRACIMRRISLTHVCLCVSIYALYLHRAYAYALLKAAPLQSQGAEDPDSAVRPERGAGPAQALGPLLPSVVSWWPPPAKRDVLDLPPGTGEQWFYFKTCVCVCVCVCVCQKKKRKNWNELMSVERAGQTK